MGKAASGTNAKVKAVRVVLGVLMTLVLGGCDLVNPSRGLASYFRRFLDSGNITVREVRVGMFPSSRIGYFMFSVSPEEFTKLKAALSLQQITSKETVRRTCLGYRDGFRTLGAAFDLWNPAWDPDNDATWLDEKGNDVEPTKPSISIYYAEPPLPPMAGNSRSSFNHLFCDSTTGTCVAILEYPYG